MCCRKWGIVCSGFKKSICFSIPVFKATCKNMKNFVSVVNFIRKNKCSTEHSESFVSTTSLNTSEWNGNIWSKYGNHIRIIVFPGTNCIIPNTIHGLKTCHVRFVFWLCCWIGNYYQAIKPESNPPVCFQNEINIGGNWPIGCPMVWPMANTLYFQL